jgi:hypothetical protein
VGQHVGEMHLKGTRRLHVFIAPMDIDDLDARAVVVGSACLGEDPWNILGPVHRPRWGEGIPLVSSV